MCRAKVDRAGANRTDLSVVGRPDLWHLVRVGNFIASRWLVLALIGPPGCTDLIIIEGYMAGRAGYENVGIEMGHLVDPNRIPDFLEIAEEYPDEYELFLNQNNVRHKGISADQQHWRDHGYLIKKNFI